MPVKLQSSSGGSVTLQTGSTASNYTHTVPSVDGTVMVSGNMPAFSAYQNSSTSLTNGGFTKVLFQVEEFDTANCYDTSTSKFTPNVAGYYQFNYVLNLSGGTINRTQMVIYKNGSSFKVVRDSSSTAGDIECGSALIYANGSTDYFEFYAYCGGASGATWAASASTYVQGFLVRVA